MKKLILLAVFVAAFVSTKAQIADTSVYQITACKIVPFKVNFTDTSLATHLGARVIFDDLKSTSQLYYCFLDSSKNIVMQGNLSINGEAYQQWDGNNKYPFTYLGNYFKIVFIKP